jgi:uncharacterized protein (TIGR02001 family)
MKKTLLAIALSSALVPLAPAVAAESDVELSANFGLVSDYRFRGVSQTDKEMAAQGGFDFAHKSGFYMGTWASNVATWANNGGNGMETDLYLGYSTEVGGVGVDIGNLYYYYPGSGDVVTTDGTGTIDPHTNEVYLGLSLGAFTFKTSYATSNYFSNPDSKGTLYYNLSAEFPIDDSTSVSAAVGFLKPKGDFLEGYDYTLGISKDLGGFSLGASYITTSGDLNDTADGNKEIAKGTVVVSISKSF